MAIVLPSRITSKDIRIEFLKDGNIVNKVVTVGVGAASAGSFTLTITLPGGVGQTTATIAYNALNSAVESALEALSNVGVDDILVTGTAPTFTLTGANDLEGVDFEVTGDGTGLTDGTLTITEVTQANGWIVLSAEASAFEYNSQTEVVDMTAISEFESTEVAVKSSMDFSVSLYNAQQSWLATLQLEELYATLRVFPVGRSEGATYFEFNFVKTGFNESYPDHEKVEIEFTGNRIGEMVADFGSEWSEA